MRYRDRQRTRLILKVIFIAVFLKLSYDYFLKNSIDAFFTRLVQLPLIYQTVESWVYWVLVLAICYGIWKLTDNFV